MRKLIVVLAVAVAATGLFGPGRASAYDSNDCGVIAHGRWADYDRTRVNGGMVDFGDNLHLNGSPQGNAILCWGSGRHSVTILGRLFVEASPNAICGRIYVDWYNRTGTRIETDARQLCKSGGHALSQAEYRRTVGSIGADLNRVRIRLFSAPCDDCGGTRLVTKNFYYGD